MAVGLLVFQRGHLVSSDEIGLFEVTRSLAERGSLEVPRQRHVFAGRDGHLYHQYAIGQALLALPFYGLGRLAEEVLPFTWVHAITTPDVDLPDRRVEGGAEIFCVGLYSFVVAGVLVGLCFLCGRSLGVSRRHAALVALLLGTCTYAALMATVFMRHATSAVALLGAFHGFHAWRRDGRLRDLLAGSVLASAILLVRVADGVAGLPLAAYVGFVLLEKRVWRVPPGRLARVVVALAAPPVVAGSVHVALNLYKWGQWLGSPMVEEGRFDTALHVSGYANLASPGMSVFVFSPLLLLLPWTLPLFWRRHRAECATILALCLVFWTVFSRYDGWPGLWAMAGPRYLFPLVPLLMLPLGLWLDATPGRLKWAPVAVLAALGAFVQASFMATGWSELVHAEGWMEFEPKWGFLFLPDASPPVAAVRSFVHGRFNDMWIVGLARGWAGRPPHPGAAAALLGLWALALALLATACWRACLHDAGGRSRGGGGGPQVSARNA